MQDQPIPQPLRAAVKETIPVIFGYVPMGIAFGLIFQQFPLPWYFAPLMSTFVFAGSAQFMAITALTNGGSILAIAFATFLINLRHLFYGISFVGKFPSGLVKKNYMIFGLTDEAFSILTTTKQPYNKKFYFYVIIISHGYWVLGTLIGVGLGKLISYDLSFLEFSLTALFIVMAIEQAYAIKKAFPFILAALASAVGLTWFNSQMLFVSILICFLVLTANFHYRN